MADGDLSATTALSQDSVVGPPLPPPQPIGIYGWRKRCLYGFVLLLMVAVIINLALTIWILRVLDFSIDGMGKLRIVSNGIRLEGEAEFVQPLYVQEIIAKDDQNLHLESAENIIMQVHPYGNTTGSSLELKGNKTMVVTCDDFKIVDSTGKMLMSVTKDNVTLGIDDMRYQGNVLFNGSVQTPTLTGPSSQPLKVIADASSVKITGADVSLMATNGDIKLISQNNILFHSNKGSILLESKNIYLKNLAISDPKKDGTSDPDVFQLCLCSSGRAFMGATNGDCQPNKDFCS